MKKILKKEEYKLTGDLSGLRGAVSGLRGDSTGLTGDATGLTGDIDQALLTQEDRKAGVNISDLIMEPK